ncbi:MULTISPECIES: hypothetical protein [unclassified Pseudomonas]|uniref:hypothetical protein n=1 Tax=unclassified Pseudomonas TaxID=196821 RepID=UPI00104252A9|nr:MULTISPECIES: hypothetical protein [unclassified Pseudomonas]
MLALTYSNALQWNGSARASNGRSIKIDVPSMSTFGQLRHQLSSGFKSPAFSKWLKENNFTDNPKVSMRSDGSVVIQDWKGGEALKSVLLTNVVQAQPVVNALKTHPTIPGGFSPLHYDPDSASLNEIAQFYGETISSDLDVNKQRAETIARNLGFQESQDNTPALHRQDDKAEQMPSPQNIQLGEMLNQRTLLTELTRMVNTKTLDLNKTMDIAPSSQFTLTGKFAEDETVSVAQFITAHGWKLPTTQEELANLTSTLKEPPLQSPPHGNFGGGLSWPIALNTQQQEEVRLETKNLLKKHLPGFERVLVNTNIFDCLTEDEHWRQADVSDPRSVLAQIINTPEARARGLLLQNKFEAAPSATSIDDWLLTSMALAIEEKVNDPSPGKHKIAGYDLSQSSHWGKPLSSIKEGLTQHLIDTQSVHFANMAPVAAFMLLSRKAPEVLVKEIPDGVTYGSHTWVAFKTAVDRIEAQAPGKTSMMNFAQVMLHADKPPITEAGERIEDIAKEEAIITWGVCNGMVGKKDLYMPDEVVTIKRAYNARLNLLMDASDTRNQALPNRKIMALEQLRNIYGSSTNFDKKVFYQNHINPSIDGGGGKNDIADAGPYSLLDLWVSGEYASRFKTWQSTDSSISVNPMIASTQPTNATVYENKLSEHATALNRSIETQIKLLISNLPLEDRKIIEHGEISLFRHMDVTTNTHRIIAREPDTTKPLLLNVNYKGAYSTYEIDGQTGSIVKRPEQGKVKPVTLVTPGGFTSVDAKATDIEQIIPVPNTLGLNPLQEQNNESRLNSFDSDRTQFIANAVLKHADIKEAIKDVEGGTTTFDTERPATREALKFFARTIPFVSSIENFIKGDNAGGIRDLVMDVFGFIVPGLPAGKAASALAKGLSTAARTLRIASKVAKAVLISASPTDLATGLGRSVIATGKAIKHVGTLAINLLKRGEHITDLFKLAKNNDIAHGSIKLANRSDEVIPITAKFEPTTGKWHAYDVPNQKSYGPPLENFQPQTSSVSQVPGSTPTLLDAGLSQDNVIFMGGRMKDLQLVASEVHTFTDTYKGTQRLNIVAHGNGASTLDRFLGEGTKVWVDGKPHGVDSFIQLLKSKGVDPASFDNVRLLICHAGEGYKGFAFADRFQKVIRKPVKAFEGPVALKYGSTHITEEKNRLVKEYLHSHPYNSLEKAESEAEKTLKKSFVSNFVYPGVDKRNGDIVSMEVATLGQPSRSENRVVTYLPRHFNRYH